MNQFEIQLSHLWPPADWCDVTVLAAVSGGADSVAMLRGLSALKTDGPGKLIVGHFNHFLRAADSEKDEQFVESLCESLGVDCELGRTESLLKDTSDGVESAARNARYEFLKSAARKHGARYVATAHTADDQAETIIHRILRGTGIAGLAGIPRVRELTSKITLIRPLLEFRRTEIIAYLKSIGQDFREDATNTDCQFTRNRIRQELLPHLTETYNETVVEALIRLGSMAGETQSIVNSLAQQLVKRCVQIDDKSIVINCDLCIGQEQFLLRELFKSVWNEMRWPQQSMTHHHWHQLADLTQSGTDGSAIVFPGDVRAKKTGGQLSLTRPQQ